MNLVVLGEMHLLQVATNAGPTLGVINGYSLAERVE